MLQNCTCNLLGTMYISIGWLNAIAQSDIRLHGLIILPQYVPYSDHNLSNVCSALKRLFQNNQITKMFTVLEIRSIQKLERKISITLANPDSVPSGQT